jgi:catechol 2,3-dioxygenase-like lactoylglutathione lyase family enzyme
MTIINEEHMETNILTEVVSKFMMLSINVSDMMKSKAFYTDKLGLKITTNYRIDDNNWWVSLAFPGGGATMTLSRTSAYPGNIKPETISLYFETQDIAAAHNRISEKEPGIGDIQDNLFGPGSGVRFFILRDPDGNLVHIVQAHQTGVPF